MRLIAAALILAVVCSCGGSSDPAPITAETPEAEQGTPLERALRLLEQCALSELDNLAELVELFQELAEPGAEPPDFKVTGIDLLNAGVHWTVDLDRDGLVDISGTLRFEDESGESAWPFDLSDLLEGTVDLPSILDAIADGTVVVLDFIIERGIAAWGSIAVTVVDGQPGAASGTMTISGTECVIRISFETLFGDPGEGVYPEGTAGIVVVSDGTTLEGALTFDGTNVVTIVLTDDNGETFVFEFDLETGELTAL